MNKDEDNNYKIIEVKNLSKSFNKTQKILENINFFVLRGSFFSLIGPSGSGKTTLLRILSQLESLDSGSVFIDGLELFVTKKTNLEIQKRTSLVFQSYNLFPHLTVLENLTLAFLYHKKGDKKTALEKAEFLLKKVSLLEKKDFYPCSLSGGQRQRVAIARSLMLSPKVLFLDEPTSALDANSIHNLIDLLEDINREGTTLFIVSHDLNFIKCVSKSCLYLDGKTNIFIPDFTKLTSSLSLTEEEKKLKNFLNLV